MFYKMIEAKRNIWLQSDNCTAGDLVAHIEKYGQMCDAQVETIKTYLSLSLACTTADDEWHSDSEIKIDKNGYAIVNCIKTKQFWDGIIRATKPISPHQKLKRLRGETIRNL